MTTTAADPSVIEAEETDPKASLRDLVSPVRGRLILGCVLSGLGAILGVVPAIAIAEIARALLGRPGETETVWWWTGVALVATVVATLAGLAASQVCHLADARFRYFTRRRVIARLASLPLGWFTTRGSGAVKRAVSDDAKSIHTLVAHTYPDAVAATAGPVTACGYLFARDWLMAVLLLGFIGAVLALAMPRLQAAYEANMEAWEEAQRGVSTGAVELIDGIEVVKAYGTTGGVFARFTGAAEDLSRVALKWMSAIGRPNDFMTNMFSAAGLIMWITLSGAVLIATGWTDPASLVAFLTVGVGLPAGLMRFVSLGYAIREAQAAATHVRSVLDTPTLPVAKVPQAPAGARVEFESVSFAYDDGTPALNNVSVVFDAGTVTAVVGPSGSGKTTLARLIPRFWDVISGRIRIGGVDVRDIDADTLLGSVAFVFQETVLLQDTVAANLRLACPQATDAQLQAAAGAARIHDRIVTLPDGYDTILGEGGAGLSGGERQRLAIARAILQDAPVIVLDEATAHADPESEHEVQRALSALAAGKTVIVIAHRLHTIRDADQILVLDRGRLVEHGTHAELITHSGRYAQLWTTQNPHREPGSTL